VPNPIRVVLDTNILLSACLKPRGNEAQVIALALRGEIVPCVSPAIEAEYRDVLFRPKFAAMQEQAARLLAALEPRFFRVDPQFQLALATDEDDNRFLECAQASAAAFLITGNLRHYPAVSGATAIVNARIFLRLTSQLY
jgi:putative PIN family toxin of toxin-antitoxin system